MRTAVLNSPVFKPPLCKCGCELAEIQYLPQLQVKITLREIAMRQEKPGGPVVLYGRCPRCRRDNELTDFYIGR